MRGRPIYWLIGVLITIVLLQQTCGNVGTYEDSEVVSVKWDTLITPWDSVPYTVYQDKPIPYDVYHYQDTGSIQYVWGGTTIDTAALIKDYLSAYYYLDTIINDSSTMLVIIEDTVAGNRITGRRVDFQDLKGDIIITKTQEIVKRRLKLFIGGTISGDLTSIGAGPSIGILTRKDKLFTFGNNLMGEQPNILISSYWKISFRRNKKIKVN